MSTNMTYAHALTEAKQVIVQQQLRIKADAEKIRSQQQTIVDQSALLADSERRLKDATAEIARVTEESAGLSARLQETTTARAQAEAMLDRQGTRLAAFQEQVADLERQVSEQARQVADLSAELDSTRAQLPSREDQDALLALTDLLAKRSAATGSSRRHAPSPAAPTMRLADDVGGEIMIQTEAA